MRRWEFALKIVKCRRENLSISHAPGDKNVGGPDRRQGLIISFFATSHPQLKYIDGSISNWLQEVITEVSQIPSFWTLS